MSTFYLLPPKRYLGEHFAGYLQSLFPGIAWTGANLNVLAESLTTTATATQPDVYVVFREDMPEGEEPAQALSAGFGAEAGDEVIEIRPGHRPGEMIVQRWKMRDEIISH